MGLSQTHALGREGRFYVVAESSFGVFAKHAGVDAFKADKVDISWKKARLDRLDVRQTRSHTERTTGKIEATWAAEGDFLPSGTAGTPPDIHAIIKAALGTYTNTPGTSDVYAPAFAQSALGSIQLSRIYNDTIMETLVGGLVDEFKLSLSGGNKPRWSASGRGKDIVYTGYSTLNGAVSAAAASIAVQTADQANFMANSVIAFGSDTNGGAGYLVSSRSGATLNITPNAVSGASNGAAVTPFAPTESVVGSPIAGILGSLTLDAGALIITDFELVVKNNYLFIDDEAFQVGLTDGIPMWRDVTGSIGFRARRDHIIHINKSRDAFTTRDLVITCGSTAGQRLIINVDRLEAEHAPLEVPLDKDGSYKLPFRAFASSAGENEIDFTLN